MAGMTIVEKIFARASGQLRVAPGDLVVVDVDTVVMIDMSFLAAERRSIVGIRMPRCPRRPRRGADRRGVGGGFTVRNRETAAVLKALPAPAMLLALMQQGGLSKSKG